MDYLELSLAVRPEAVEAAADIVRRFAPAGVSIEPPYEAIDEEGNVSLDGDAPVRLRAWVAEAGEAQETVRALRRALGSLDGAIVRPMRARDVREEAWSESWKRHFPVLRVGKRIVVRPSWRRHRARRGDLVIQLDPGMAFGTGQHPTTRMCLEVLEERIAPGADVLDVGCGSGILSVAAALLGAKRVDAIDIDPAAVQAAGENAKQNGAAALIRVAQGSIEGSWRSAEPAAGRYDLVLANLSSRLVQELAVPLVAALRGGGVALVSGLIAEHEARCRRTLVSAGGDIIEARGDGDWRLLVVARLAPRPATSDE